MGSTTTQPGLLPSCLRSYGTFLSPEREAKALFSSGTSAFSCELLRNGNILNSAATNPFEFCDFPLQISDLSCGRLISWPHFCDLSMLVKCSSGWWCKHTTHLVSGDHSSRGRTPLRWLLDGYFTHTFQLPMTKEDSKPSKRRQHRHFLKSLHWAKHLQDNLRELWDLGSVGFGFVLRGH